MIRAFALATGRYLEAKRRSRLPALALGPRSLSPCVDQLSDCIRWKPSTLRVHESRKGRSMLGPFLPVDSFSPRLAVLSVPCLRERHRETMSAGQRCKGFNPDVASLSDDEVKSIRHPFGRFRRTWLVHERPPLIASWPDQDLERKPPSGERV